MSDPYTSTGGPAAEQLAQAQALVARGDELLLRYTKSAEAAGAYSQALQLAPNLVSAHLGMAEANWALSAVSIARTAADYVIRLAPNTNDAKLAGAIVAAMDRQFPQALELSESVIREDAGNSYAHALRGYSLRSMGNDYDARLAEAKAARLSSSGDLRPLFPRIEPTPMFPPPFATPNGASAGQSSVAATPLPPINRQWTPPTPVRRRAAQTRFALRGYPIATFSLMGVFVLGYLLNLATKGHLADVFFQDNDAVRGGSFWLIFTSIFLQDQRQIIGLLFSLFSMYFVGSNIERIWGIPRFLLIFFSTAFIGGLIFAFGNPGVGIIGPSAGIAGIFGALGAYLYVNRNRLGPYGSNLLQQWGFWLALNVIFNLQIGSLWQWEVGGLVAGMALGLIIPPQGSRR